MTDVLGPAAAGAPRAIASSDPSITATIQFPDAADTWFQDCVNNTAGTGTPYVAEWANRQLQQIRRVVRNSGVSLTYADDQLGYAIQQGLRWVGSFGGTANALQATMVPAQPTLVAGTEIKGLITATNTGSATLNVNGLGALPIALPDGTPLTGAEMVIGGVASLIYTGSSFVLLAQSLLGFQRIIQTNTTFNINNSAGNASGDTIGDGSASSPWFSLAHALKVLATYNLNGNTVTVQLTNTGVPYAAPLQFFAPSNGTLAIQGDPAAQGSYIITGAPAVGNGVLNASSGSVKIVGVTIRNTVAGGSGILSSNSQITIQNVTIATTIVGSQALLSAGPGGSITAASGCIMSGSANSMWLSFDGGSIAQSANCATASGPSYSSGCMVAAVNGNIAVTTTGLSWTGSGATGGKGSASLCGVINSAGAPSFWPGVAAVTTATGGQSA